MKIPLLFLTGLAMAAAPPLFAESETLPILSVDSDGSPSEETLPSTLLRERYRNALLAVHDSALPALREVSARSPWKLKTVVVGIGVGLEAGLGPVIKAKAVPRFRVVFSSSGEPILP